MANLFELTADVRTDLGKGASRRLRESDHVPAIIYGAGKDPVALTLNHHHVVKALENEAFYSHILKINIAGETQQAVLKDLQRHPYKPKIVHMDFLRIDPKEKLTMQIPLHFKGGEESPGVKQGGVVMHLANAVEVRCLPANLPEYIEVDISQLELDHTIHLSQLALPKGVELTAFIHGHAEEHDEGVVKIQIPRVAVEEETSVVAEGVTPEGEATEAQPAESTESKKPEEKK